MIARWTVKELFGARLRVLGSTLAVGAAFLLVIVFKAVWEGETKQLAVYLERAGADLWVMQANVSNMHMASSFLTEGKRTEIGSIEGVEELAGILYLNTMVAAGDRQWYCYVVGTDERGQLGGPWSVTKGADHAGPGEVIVPETLARITDTGLGDEVRIADRLFTIVGLSEETFSATNPVVFVHALDLSDLLSLTGYDSYVLVRAAQGVSPAALADEIEREVDGVAVLTTPEFVESDTRLAKQMGAEVIALMTAIGAVLASLLVAAALYIHTSHNRRELAILRALGFARRHVYATVMIQAALLTGLAFLFAVIAAGLLAVTGPRLAPILSLSITARSLAEIGLSGLLVAVLATMVMARRVSRVDPMSAFDS